MSILGNTQPGWVDKPIVAVDAPGVGGTGLKITGGQSVILDLCLEAFGNAIEIDNKGGNVIGGCYLGTDLSGLAEGSNDTGVLIYYSTGNAIGGAAAAFHNVICGNTYAGVVVVGTADGNDISGNYIGVGADGATPIGNGYGVVLDCSGATVGSPAAGGGNVISGNKSSGIYIDDGNGDFGSVFVRKNLIRGNLIGTDATGTKAVGNGGDGITVENTTDDTIGGAAAGEGNVIAANQFYWHRFRQCLGID